jgi:DNA-binding NtrC family response regulator
MDCTVGLITQNRGLERVMRRISDHFGCGLKIFESCADFVKNLKETRTGVVIVDGLVCSQPRHMDLQIVLTGAPGWQVLYLPRTARVNEVKDAVELGAFGSLHNPVSEEEIRQMVQSAIGM